MSPYLEQDAAIAYLRGCESETKTETLRTLPQILGLCRRLFQSMEERVDELVFDLATDMDGFFDRYDEMEALQELIKECYYDPGSFPCLHGPCEYSV
jgi:hypothetical protein